MSGSNRIKKPYLWGRPTLTPQPVMIPTLDGSSELEVWTIDRP
jgi:hypothetical protein